MLQQIAWPVSLALMILLAIGFMFVALKSGRRADDYTPMQVRAYRIRTKLFWGLVLVLGPTMVYNLADLPYSASYARPAESGAQAMVIDVKGHQWRWELSRNRVAVGQPVEFRVTSADINHGFAIYDPDMHLVAQTQAMPGYTNKLNYTFRKKGTYKILCLEYCGIAHHNMMTEIDVGGL
ncbi:cupredoxin domain-containing protein [Noviherbaspirillum autotrophicum]|uniref:Cytochrome c oxidase subunit II n=1 Tax=Noviherbaspirillum autotrophicum TaxID=709839 RepID=A0A0C2BH92_9BURK|nr:cytochrome c oxidase subunit II [Noviherbaspirillum autotrophicum]KIF80620.1 cytochrome c oxidase subunit II [Noviherbaspirillum autotrophicum]